MPSFLIADSPPPPEPQDLRSKSLLLVKIWCLLVLFAVTLFAGVSPYLMKWSDGFLLIGTQLAGGVFLGTALMQFLSDSNDVFQNLTDKHYPFAFLLAALGFSFSMLADCLILHLCRKHSNFSPNAADATTLQARKSIASSSSIIGAATASQTQVDSNTDRAGALDLLFLKAVSFSDSVLLITALCFHAVFEGITVGLADTENRAWRALWTVGLNRVFASIAMSTALLKTNIPDFPLSSCVAYAFSFAISSPVGIAIGIVMDATTRGFVADWIYAIAMGFGCGVFIWVSVSHLLLNGFMPPQRRISVNTPHHKFLAVITGVGIVSVAIIWDQY
ncbi:zinc transporter 2-like [Impatiens glandulifera]|uniref:zinc transporter 2-like n=1 Tax=Impatiens glandulifera TaxID=253017 RepID=UPI001FB15F1C|nr:zinc transporter 2-like [Impatiens glandulifera]